MRRRHSHHAATTRSSDHPNPTLYVSVSGDVTWDRWRELCGRDIAAYKLQLAACSFAERLPRDHDPDYKQRLQELRATLAYEELMELFESLPVGFQPVRTMIGERLEAFCLALEARVINAGRR